ncbi:MAG TPA: CHAT domain-containing tetratricopeptide repeat protein [Cyclobacteriaceae bacterium]|jgi:CHAT domain-containing protein|nr:CHAT domain-containing tetratricopeptide repeat protein [Cyclobacteriaceae bacterium]
MKNKIVLIVLFVIPFIANAQFGGLIKKGLKKGAEKGKDLATNANDKARDRLDSTDFNYAISVIDNSGMMDIRDVGESFTKTADFASNNFLKDQSKVTPAQKSRNTLDVAEKFYETRHYKTAELNFLDAKLSYETNNITDNINYSKVYADLGLLYATMGRFNTAKQYTSEALSMREKSLGKSSKAYASSLNNSAVLFQEMAQYNEAEQYFKDALAIVKQALGEQSQEYAIVLNNQAIFFSKIGRYDQAVEKLKSAIAILEQQQKNDLRNTVGFQSNLALLYQKTGKLTEAEAIYLKLEKALKAQGNNPFYAGVLDNLALLYIQMNKLDKVEGYFKQSAQVYKDRFGAQNPNYAKVLNDLGNFYRMQGKFTEAEQTLTESLSIRASALDTNHPDYVKSEEDLGILYWKKGDTQKAYNNLQSAMNKSLDFISRYFPPMSEAEKTKYWDILQPRFQRFYNYCLDAQAANPAIVEDMYNYQIVTKGLLLNSTNKIKMAIFSSGNADLIKDYINWLDKKEALARYYSLSKEDLKNQKIDLASLEQEANDMERSLSQRSSDFSQGYSAEKISHQNISTVLGDTEAIVEFIRIRTFDKDFTSDSKYAALMLAKNAQPKLVVLDNGNQLETRYAKFYRNAVQQKVADQYSYDQFWARIEPSLAGKKTIYISPDGVYNQINLNTLKKTGGDFVISKFDLAIIGNSKDLIGLKSAKASTKKDAFLLGFPNYGGTSVASLPGTKVEVEGISKILKTTGYQVSLSEQNEATESKIKSVKGSALVHIATHGYFLQDAESGAVGVDSENAKNNPLLRSGLLLAGAAKTMSGEVLPNLESNDNGVLTAYEAMNLNLNGTDLIVLSACETGLGDVRAGEGVYGLQRAFIVAGAKAMVMSLWKVDDAATQALMTNFYTNLSKGGSKLKAFKQAQQQLMLKYKDPYYWGAFVMVGM